MAFDVRLREIPSVDTSYNTQTMHKLREWTSRRSDILTVEAREAAVIENDKEITRTDGDDRNVVDNVFEENDNAVGYFKEWDEPNEKVVNPLKGGQQTETLQIARMRRKRARFARKRTSGE